MPIGQIEDDTAQISPQGKNILVNTDVLVEDVHFSDQTTSPEDAGWRAITTNLSDLASSGVEEILGITVGMIAPANTPWSWVEGVYTGIDKALTKFGGKVIGGDCSSGNQKVLAITAIGTVGKLRLHRSEAMDGDLLVASGPHGLSRLGLALLKKEPLMTNKPLSERLKAAAIEAHKRPKPPLEALTELMACKPTKVPWRAAATDSSDGLLNAVENLCISSQCQAELDLASLPREKNWPLGSNWDEWCLSGGEDFELILSIPPLWAKALIKAFPSSKIIGLIKSGPPKLSWNDGQEIKQSKINEFKHF